MSEKLVPIHQSVIIKNNIMFTKDRAKIKASFSRAAAAYDKHADIQASLCDELVSKLRNGEIYAKTILDIGCGTGRLMAGLEKSFADSLVVGMDISEGMAVFAAHRGVKSFVADAQELPFGPKAFDLVVSNGVYQWAGDLKSSFREARRVLKKNGYFVFNCFGSRTLEELRLCLNIKQNILPSKERIYKALQGAGFTDVEMNVKLQRKYFDSLSSILYWLKSIGANQAYTRAPFFTSRKLMSLDDCYNKHYGDNNRVYATFEVIYIKAAHE